MTMTDAKEVHVKMTSRVQGARKAIDMGSNRFEHVIAVGSGKGGVGKSTVSANIALALAKDGAKVGLMDADIYGPNTPRMLGIEGLPLTQKDGKIRPAEILGMKVLSIGFMVPDGQALIWRGPLLHSAIQQFVTDFDWGGALDYLVVDMPPGTGDVQLSLSQTLPIDGAVIVTTPQQVATDDAHRAVTMFEKLEIPLFGIVENMAYLPMPDGTQLHVFGEKVERILLHTSARDFGQSAHRPPAIAKGGDRGLVTVMQEPLSDAGQAFVDIARNIAAEASKVAYSKRKADDIII